MAEENKQTCSPVKHGTGLTAIFNILYLKSYQPKRTRLYFEEQEFALLCTEQELLIRKSRLESV